MKIGPLELTWRAKAVPMHSLSPSQNGWWPVVSEPFLGAWQRDVEVRAQDVLTYSAVYACVTLIAGDIAKLCLRLVTKTEDGIWEETENPAFSPVLRTPNRYQTIDKFVEQWIVSKLIRGNTYVLKQRDNRRVVTALYVLDPSRVTPLVTDAGDVYYELKRDDLSQIRGERIIVPASEIIHDVMCGFWHPLLGVSPIYACGIPALQGIAIQNNGQKFFANGSHPGGFLTAPGRISQETAARLKTYFEANFSGTNVGKVAVGGEGLKYEPLTMTAVDAQLIDQLKWSAENVCTCFHVPPYMIGIGAPPPYANVEPLLGLYNAVTIQTLTNAFEKALDKGLGLTDKIDGVQYGTEFDIADLIWMDTATRLDAATKGIGSGAMSPNEARVQYLNLGRTTGGETPYMQQQNWPLDQLAERPAPGTPSPPAVMVPAVPPTDDEDDDDETDALSEAAAFSAYITKGLALHA